MTVCLPTTAHLDDAPDVVPHRLHLQVRLQALHLCNVVVRSTTGGCWTGRVFAIIRCGCSLSVHHRWRGWVASRSERRRTERLIEGLSCSSVRVVPPLDQCTTLYSHTCACAAHGRSSAAAAPAATRRERMGVLVVIVVVGLEVGWWTSGWPPFFLLGCCCCPSCLPLGFGKVQERCWPKGPCDCGCAVAVDWIGLDGIAWGVL